MSYVTIAVSAYNQVQAGRNAKAQRDMTAMSMDFNAKVEEQSALETARVIRHAGARTVATANAAYAAAGVKVGDGSAAVVEQQINQDVEHDAYQALLEGFRRGAGLRTEGAMQRATGRAEQAAGVVNAGSTVVGGYYSSMRAQGWRSNGPGFSGQQAPAPVVDRSFKG